MARKNPDQIAEKWARRLAGATEDIRQGVEGVSEAPSQKAIQKKDKMIKEWTEAINSGKWERSLSKVGLDDWKQAFLEKGLSRIPSGAEASKPKFEEFMNQLLPYIDNVKSKIERMPDTTLEDRINRAVAFMREMSKFSKK